MLRRTLHAAKYLSDPACRRKVARQLNKGESLHALRRDLHYAQQGAVTEPALADQTDQAWCLNVLTNSVIIWTTEYYSLAVRQLRAAGRDVPDELLAHISPAHSENINFFGVINVDVEAELAKLDSGGWRPLRPVAAEMALMSSPLPAPGQGSRPASIQDISRRRPRSAASRSARSLLRSAHRPESRSSLRLRTARRSASGPTLVHTDIARRT